MLQACDLPIIDFGHGGNSLVANLQLFKTLVIELDRDLFSACFIAFIYQQFDKLWLIKVTANNNFLTLLNVYTCFGDQARILAKNCLFHNKDLLKLCFPGFFHNR